MLNNTCSLGGIAITNDYEALYIGTEQDPPRIFLLNIENLQFTILGSTTLARGNFVRQISLSPKSNLAYATTSCGYQNPCTQNYTAVIGLLTNKPGSHKQDINWWWILIMPTIFASFLVGSCFYRKGREIWFVTVPTKIREKIRIINSLIKRKPKHVPLAEEEYNNFTDPLSEENTKDDGV